VDLIHHGNDINPAADTVAVRNLQLANVGDSEAANKTLADFEGNLKGDR
jgi:hypothetical protein